MVKRVTRAESKARTRATLVEVGGELFADAGYNAVTVEAIVERAGFTRGAFYANFTDKADLFLTIIEQNWAAEMDAAAAVTDATPDDQKLDAIQAWYDGIGTRGPWGRAYSEFWPHARDNPEHRSRMAARYRAEREAIAAVAERWCEAAGVALPRPALEFAAFLVALGEGLASQREIDPDAIAPNAFTDGMALLWFGMMASAPPDGA